MYLAHQYQSNNACIQFCNRIENGIFRFVSLSVIQRIIILVHIESHNRKEPIICERDTLYICMFLPRTIEMPWHANASLFISLARESEKVGELCLLLERRSKKKTSLSLSINQMVFGRRKRSSISIDRLWKQPKCTNQSHVSFPT